ncbi:uncharacterized protein EDB91DRAFT_1336139, partial [Suillus paluster]|uniref:uncharacterized protein n=1 Tax=Suillus paluster TaxID=48578 RepID=UPI001B866362
MSTTSSLAGDLAKLTVPQLKALCKECRIVGYSKLGKAALLQKLTDNNVHNPQPAIPIQAISTSEITVPVEHTSHPASSLAPALSIGVTSFLDPTHDTQTAHKDSTPNISAKLFPQPKTLPASCIVGPSAATVRHSSTTVVAASSPDVQAPDENHGTKRPRVSAIFKSAKRQKPSPVNAASIWDADSSTSTTQPSTSAGTLKLHTGLISVTESAAEGLPRNSSVSSKAVPIVAQLRDAQLVQKESTTNRQGRFKPLVFTRIPIVASTPVISQKATALNDHSADETTCTPSDTFSFEAAPLSTPSFVNITFPPKLSDRKQVQRWAIILAALSDQDRHICVLVSRAFRYAGNMTLGIR